MDLEIVKKIKVVAFDFDGVIADSNRLKRNAWFQIFPESLNIKHEEIQEILDFKGGETRFVILREIFTKKGITNEKEIESFVNEYAQKFDERVQGGAIFMPEVEEILPRLASQVILYINSATPTESLCAIVKKMGIIHYFKDVLGNPGTKNTESKKDNLRLILELEKVTPEELLFIGDHQIDRAAAEAIGCQFLGVPNEFNKWSEEMGFFLLPHFSMIESYLKN